MDDPRWLRLITVGLILAALVVGYSLLSGGFVKSKPVSKETKVSNEVVAKTPYPAISSQSVPSLGTPSAGISSSPTSAFDRIAERRQGNVQILPKTGFPMGLISAFAVSAMIVGLGLRRFPY